MEGTIIKQGNRQFVRVKFSIDEDDIHFKNYPTPTTEHQFDEGDEVEFEVEEESYVYDDGSEEKIKWAINVTLKFTPPFKVEGKLVLDSKGVEVAKLKAEESAIAYATFLNDICEI
jgi:hypothetical protein